MSDSGWPAIGQIVSFFANPDSMALALPACDTTKPLRLFCGTVTDVGDMQSHGAGKIPTKAVTIRGRKGTSVTIDGAACYLRDHPSFTEAEKRKIPLFP